VGKGRRFKIFYPDLLILDKFNSASCDLETENELERDTETGEVGERERETQ